MEWTQSETLALANQHCVHCHGLGLCSTRGSKSRPCKCVLRAIFKGCYRRFQKCTQGDRWFSRSHILEGRRPNHARYQVYGFRNEEYIADFLKVSNRTLGENTLAQRVFKYHYLLGADWKLCCRRLGMERGAFFHEVYRIEERLGLVFRELEPFSLWPLDEYFGGTVRSARVAAARAVAYPERSSPALRVPLESPTAA